MELEHFSNAYTQMKIEDGVLVVTYLPNLDITIDIARICVEDRIKFTKNKMYPLLAFISEMQNVSKEAKEFLASAESMKGITAGAFVVENHLQRLIGSVFISLYINMNEVKMPTKLFNNKQAAMVWAKQYRVQLT